MSTHGSAAPAGRARDARHLRAGIVPGGFTLLEILAVLVVMALLATLAVLSLAPSLQAARMSEAMLRIEEFDRQTRLFAQRFGSPCSMSIERGADGMSRRQTGADSASGARDAKITLPRGFRFEQVLTASAPSQRPSAQIACSSGGLTCTYALCVAGPGDVRRWIIVHGLSGEISQTTDETRVRAIFSMLQSTRDDPG